MVAAEASPVGGQRFSVVVVGHGGFAGGGGSAGKVHVGGAGADEAGARCTVLHVWIGVWEGENMLSGLAYWDFGLYCVAAARGGGGETWRGGGTEGEARQLWRSDYRSNSTR